MPYYEFDDEVEFVTFLRQVKKTPQLHEKDDDGNSLLHLATEYSLGSIQLCLEAGIEVNVRNDDNETPLGWTVNEANIPCTKLLLDWKADPNITMEGGNSLMHAAACCEDSGMLVFLQHYCKLPINVINSNRETLLHIAAENDSYITALWLLQNGADAFKADTKNQLPIHIASKNDSQHVLQLLLQRVPEHQLDFKDINQKTPYEVASRNSVIILKSFFDYRDSNILQPCHRISGGVTKHAMWKPASGFQFSILLVFLYIFTMIHILIVFWNQSDWIIFYGLALLTCIFIRYKAQKAPPGYLGATASEATLLRTDYFMQLLYEGKTKELCFITEKVKPWRAVFCKEVGQCIRRYDHYSRILNTPIGLRNVIWFFIYLCSCTLTCSVYFFANVMVLVYKSDNAGAFYVSLVMGIQAGAWAFTSGYQTLGNFSHISKNITVMDLRGKKQQPWFDSRGGSLYDYGCIDNFLNLWYGQEPFKNSQLNNQENAISPPKTTLTPINSTLKITRS